MDKLISNRNNLSKILLEKNISEIEFAQIVGVSEKTIISIENGEVVPNMRLALTISTELEKKFEEVFIFLEN